MISMEGIIQRSLGKYLLYFNETQVVYSADLLLKLN